MRVLVTRPAEEGERLAQLLRQRGHEPILSPAIDICLEDGPELSLDGVQGILITSANAARALALRTNKRDIPVFAVGPQTTEAARKAGFVVVHNANGNSAALAREVGQRASPGAGKLLYATGDISGDAVICELAHHGFHVEVLRLYRASERTTLNEAAAAALHSGNIDAVMLFSPRSARAFVQQVHRASLQDRCGNAVALCISHAVADALHPLRFAEIRVAAHPDRDSMLDLLS